MKQLEKPFVFALRLARSLFLSHRAHALVFLSLSLLHTHIQIHKHTHKHEHKHTTGARNSQRSYTQSDLMLSFTRAMSLSCVLARTLYAE